MNNIVVVVFPDEERAHEGVRALQELHREGNVAVYATAVLQREPNGELLVKRHSNPGPLGLGVGAVAGGLIGILGGPLGAAAGVAAGALAGSMGDVMHMSLGDEFIEAVQRDLTPGTSAVIGEVSEESIDTIDKRMKALGGNVTRERRKDFVAGFVEDDTAPIRADLADISAEQAGRKVELMESKLDFDVENAKEKLQRDAEKARERVDRIKQEMEAKLDVLRDQAARARPEVRDRIQRRVADVRKDLEQREEKLLQAYELTRRALH
jgi:uncharacterized membrane protein